MNVDWRTAKSNRDAAAAMGDMEEMNEWQDYLDIHFDYTELRSDWMITKTTTITTIIKHHTMQNQFTTEKKDNGQASQTED